MNKTFEELREQLEAKLVHDLRKSGFYSEMRAVQACVAAGWECRGSFTYFAKDERATRECDFEAMWEWFGLNGDGIQIVARLVGQVKKSETPWIVFIDRRAIRDGWNNMIATNTLERERFRTILRRHSLVSQNGWIGTGIHEAFKAPTERSRWYSAFVSVCKAAEFALHAAVVPPRPAIYFELVQPVVVLDGMLIRAELSPHGVPLLTETAAAAFRFEYRSDAYERPHYDPDVITIDALPRYLELLKQRMIAVKDVLLAQRYRG